MNYGGAMGGWGWLFGALVLVGIVLLVVVAVRLLGGGSSVGTSGGGPALAREDPRARARALLDERYARGEISTDEYRERRQTLEEGGL